jgi:GntR family transcriptional regulator/MocR family aminotransferase
MFLALEGDGPLYLQVYNALCHAIEDGRLLPGGRLPGSRTLAQALGVSRTVVLQAFAELDSEGITVGNRGSGTYVRAAKSYGRPPVVADHRYSDVGAWNDRLPRPSEMANRMLSALPRRAAKPATRALEVMDFALVRAFQDALGQRQWERAVIDALHAQEDGPQDVFGVPALRRMLADMLLQERGVAVDAEDITIVSSAQQAFDLIACVLISPGMTVGIEDPAYRGIHGTLAGYGAKVVACAAGGHGFDIHAHAGALADAKLVHVMPSQQFPTGTVMTEQQRLALLGWAYRQGAYIVEDDFHSEHRLVSRALPPLFALDTREQVIHVGVFAREFLPSLRLAYVVAPRSLQPFIQAAKWSADRGSDFFMQSVLARYLASGDYLRNLRRLYILLIRQHEVLCTSLESHLGARATHDDAAPSGNLLLHLPAIPYSQTDRFLAEAVQRGVLVKSADVYYATPPDHLTLLLRYVHVPATVMDTAARLLAEVHDHIFASLAPGEPGATAERLIGESVQPGRVEAA